MIQRQDNQITVPEFIQHLRDKIEGVRNQVAYTTAARYAVPCPHCNHSWEFKGIPAKSVHKCGKCYGYFGIDDARVIFNFNQSSFKTRFRVSAIYPNSIFDRDMDKMADVWADYSTKTKKSLAMGDKHEVVNLS